MIRRRAVFIYTLPGIHLCVSLFATIGYYAQHAPRLAGQAWDILAVIDFPISFVALVLAWQHGILADIWVIVAGTLWWYCLSIGIIRLVHLK
jgi:hypothetical protein